MCPFEGDYNLVTRIIMLTASIDNIKEHLNYNPESGVFTWIKRDSTSNAKIGSAAGSKNNKGYILISIKGVKHRAHRISWAYMTGEWPKDQIDHINGVKNDNRWSNIRLATGSQNMANRPKGSKNTSGFKGVSWNKKSNKWRVKITKHHKEYYLGFFDDPEEGYKAYCKAAKELHGEFARG